MLLAAVGGVVARAATAISDVVSTQACLLCLTLALALPPLLLLLLLLPMLVLQQLALLLFFRRRLLLIARKPLLVFFKLLLFLFHQHDLLLLAQLLAQRLLLLPLAQLLFVLLFQLFLQLLLVLLQQQLLLLHVLHALLMLLPLHLLHVFHVSNVLRVQGLLLFLRLLLLRQLLSPFIACHPLDLTRSLLPSFRLLLSFAAVSCPQLCLHLGRALRICLIFDLLPHYQPGRIGGSGSRRPAGDRCACALASRRRRSVSHGLRLCLCSKSLFACGGLAIARPLLDGIAACQCRLHCRGRTQRAAGGLLAVSEHLLDRVAARGRERLGRRRRTV